MAEFRKLPTQAELQNMLFMEQMRVKNPQQIAQEALASGTTVRPIPENVFQKIAGGARTAGEFVNRAGSAADLAKLFPGYKPETKVTIPTGYNFAPKQDPMGGVIPGGLQTQNVNLGQVLGAIKPADVLGISGAERAYSDIGAGKAPQPLDVLDVAGLGATGLVGGKAALRATKGVPVGMSIQEAKGLLTEAPRSPLGFYSALEESALNLQRNKGSGQAFLNDLQKAPNVKADEIKWTGLDEFLKTKPNVTKQEVQDYLANNRVEVQEVRSTVPRLPGEEMPGDKGAFLPKFGQYTLPGGENYREILLTMPTKTTKLRAEADRISKLTNPTPEEIEIFKEANRLGDQEYRSTHFPDQRNILAHLRVNDRVDADGKKMLLVEEVQSDWHQAGREKGYMTPPQIESYQPKNLQTNYSDFFDMGDVTGDNGRVLGQVNKQPNGKFKSEVILEQGKTKDLGQFATKDEAFDAIKNLKLYTHKKTGTDIGEYDALFLSKEDALSSAKLSGVPDAPFKDSWYQLALKRAIQYAAENGYDRIGLTTGSQQAARFDLSKHIKEIDFSKPSSSGKYYVEAKSNDGNVVLQGNFTKDEIESQVGKEIADKIVSGGGEETNNKGISRLAGLDLQVGGEGMKKYYDEIYPKFLDKYGKKWGARVGETSLGGTGAAFDYYKSGNMFDVIDGNNNVVGRFNSAQEAAKQVDKLNAEGTETVRYLDVTPEMKASVSKGQPLFQALPAIPATGLLATQDEER